MRKNYPSKKAKRKAAGVPVFVKQLDINGKVVHDINQFPESLRVREWPEYAIA